MRSSWSRSVSLTLDTCGFRADRRRRNGFDLLSDAFARLRQTPARHRRALIEHVEFLNKTFCRR